MKQQPKRNRKSEYEFALVLDGVKHLNRKVEDALFESGCDDATFSMQHGRLYAEFSRTGASLLQSILEAIADVLRANVGAKVLRVDSCELVTQADIARRIGKSRQLVSLYIKGTRGAGNFPPPEHHLTEGDALWTWSEVSKWLQENALMPEDEMHNALTVAIVNNALEGSRHRQRYPALTKRVQQTLSRIAG